MKYMHWISIGLIWAVVLLLGGCKPLPWSDPSEILFSTPTGALVVKITIPAQPTRNPIITHAANTPVAEQLPSPTLVPTSVVLSSICSPLKDHLIEELPGIISDPYRPPPMGKDDRHQGVDFSYYRRGERMSIEGVLVQAVLPGRVAAAVLDSFPFGNMVIVETPGYYLPDPLRELLSIQDGESLYTLYAHLGSTPQVNLGDEVQACQVLGQVGKTGNAGVAHLHLEMRHGAAQTQFPVMAYYLAENTPQERQNYLRWATSGEFLHFDPMELLQYGWLP